MNNTPTSPYNTPQSPAAAMGNQAPVLSLGDWIITLIVLAIPLVNLVMLFVWGFGSKTNPNKANFCKAYLVIMAVFLVLYILLAVMLGIGGAFSSSGQ